MDKCFESYIVLDGQDKNLPAKVKKDIRKIWDDYELNDNGYFMVDAEDLDDYPNLSKFLIDKKVPNCLVNYYW